ncbi:MAG TPA: LysR substrate-binding domain-containing protein [Micromonosporaceae bacterium]|nr:LysR substrate-binding domain-containing protein [Micromonosporaceae bacterium]
MDLLRHLRHFVVVARELHFGRAADLLGIAQPPLSQSIKRLERELDVELFDRSRRQVQLTPAGQLLLSEAETLLAGQERLRNLMRQVRDGALGVMRVGVPPETPAVKLRMLLDRLGEKVPGLDIDLQELTSAEQVRSLAEGRLDVGIVHHPVEREGLRFGKVVDVPIGVVLPRVSPLARAHEIALADLSGHDLVIAPRATAPGWYDHILEVCRIQGFSPGGIRHARNPEFLFGLVLAGQSVAFEQESVARREPRIAWRPIAGRPLIQRTSAAWPERSPHPAAPVFAEVAADVLAGAEPMLTAPDIPLAEQPWRIIYETADTARSHLT